MAGFQFLRKLVIGETEAEKLENARLRIDNRHQQEDAHQLALRRGANRVFIADEVHDNRKEEWATDEERQRVFSPGPNDAWDDEPHSFPMPLCYPKMLFSRDLQQQAPDLVEKVKATLEKIFRMFGGLYGSSSMEMSDLDICFSSSGGAIGGAVHSAHSIEQPV